MRTRAEMEVIEYAQYLKRARSEASFQRALEGFAKLMGWRIFHDRDSRKNDEGFPDLWAVRNGQLIAAELKVGKNRRSNEQLEWGHELLKVADAAWDLDKDRYSQPFRYYLWYPTHWPEIVAVLKQPHIEVELT